MCFYAKCSKGCYMRWDSAPLLNIDTNASDWLTASHTSILDTPPLNPRLLSYCWGLHITSLHPCHTSSRYGTSHTISDMLLFFTSEIFSFAIPEVVPILSVSSPMVSCYFAES